MPTPSLQTLVTDAKAVLALQNMTTIRSTMAVALANANTGTPLNPGLTSQQLINEVRQVITLPKSDIESIIVNQLMKFLNSPPAPGGVGADKQVIWNDAGVLTGDPNFTWDGPTSRLTVSNATITGNLTVDTNVLFVDASNNRVGIGTATPGNLLSVRNEAASGIAYLDVRGGVGGAGVVQISGNGTTLSTSSFDLGQNSSGAFIYQRDALPLSILVNGSERYAISSSGVATWSNVGGVAGTAMTLNSTGLGVGATPELKLRVDGPDAAPATSGSSTTNGAFRIGAQNASTNLCVDAGVSTTGGIYGWFQARARNNYANNYDLVFNPNGGNVGIGVTPSSTIYSSSETRLVVKGNYANYSGTIAVQSKGTTNTVTGFLTAGDIVNEIALGSVTNTPINFYTNNAIKATIDTSGNLILQSSATPATLTTNGQLTVNATSNTNLRFSYRGSDGVTRVADIILT